MDSNLKPCPFCGGEANGDANVSFDDEYGFFIKFSVGCKRCKVFMTHTLKMVSNMPIYNIQDAIKIATNAWNRRAEGWPKRML